MCVSVPKECVLGILNLSAKQWDWLSHARPAPFPFPLFLHPGWIPPGMFELIFSILENKEPQLGIK